MPKQNIHVALFDVRPKLQPASFRVQQVVNLRKEKPTKIDTPKVRPKEEPYVHSISAVAQLTAQDPVADPREIIAHEVETALQEDSIVADVIRAGATFHPSKKQEPARPRAIAKDVLPEPKPLPPAPVRIPDTEDFSALQQFWTKPESPVAPVTLARASVTSSTVSHPAPRLSPAARDVEHWLQQSKQRRAVAMANVSRKKVSRKALIVAALVCVIGGGVAVAAFASSEYVVQKEHQVMASGNQAVASLEDAKASLEDLNFAAAADHFALAYEEFDKASDTLNVFGASFFSLFGKGKSANNLIQAGQYISKAGESLSRAFSDFYKINFFAATSFGAPLEDFQDVLRSAEDNITKANKLLNNVDVSVIPEEKRATFEEFRKQVPSFQAYIGSALEYSDMLLDLVGNREPKTYLVLFQNTSERRPTGGFPGTYAILSFERGTLKKVFVDDIYNPDGQIKVNMIPPKPLQHITPNWGLRDVNWFADFPTSAKKIQEYYKYDGGASLDGVFAITPEVVTRLLEIIGPIEMPEYGVTLTEKNFLSEIQGEVEYGDNREQPKKIVVDFQPKFFEKLAQQQGKDTWISIVKVMFTALQEKQIMAYFADNDLQQLALERGFAGEIKKTDGDYVQVAFSNVKGAKTDAVTANYMKLSVDGPSHVLTINRSHQGGDSKYAFYNRENTSYVKVYLPKGSSLVSADGITKTSYKPLIAHLDLGFKPDPDLVAVESTSTQPIPGVDVFEESDKTVFGFWLNTKAKKVSTATIVYTTPEWDDRYQLYWQKQSGSDGDLMHVSVQAPEGKVPQMSPLKNATAVQVIGDTAVYDADLSVDRSVEVVFN